MLNTTRRECKSLTEMMSDLNLKQIIESPTRITDISQSLIDVILVSSPNTVRDSGVLNCTISDHLPV
jgi:endonuclease/exonuclease/phosphatase family metal-dependent hydrolase